MRNPEAAAFRNRRQAMPPKTVSLTLNDKNLQFVLRCAEAHEVPPDEVLNRCVTMAANMGLALHAGMFFAAYWNDVEEKQVARQAIPDPPAPRNDGDDELSDETPEQRLARLKALANGQ